MQLFLLLRTNITLAFAALLISTSLHAANGPEGMTSSPGGGTVNNFASLEGYTPVNPSCYSGSISINSNARITSFSGGTFYSNEEISVSPVADISRSAHFNQAHTWNVHSDPLAIAGVVSTSAGGGTGTARISLETSSDGQYRLVSDVQPRSGNYQIITTGPISKSTTEDFFFALADHHYGYVSAQTPPTVAAFLQSLGPPNVMTGRVTTDAEGVQHIQGNDSATIPASYGVVGNSQRQWNLILHCSEPLE